MIPAAYNNTHDDCNAVFAIYIINYEISNGCIINILMYKFE